MKAVIWFLFIIMSLVSCRKNVEDTYFDSLGSYGHMEETVSYSITLPGNVLKHGDGMEAMFMNEAGKECFRLTSRKVLNLQPLVQGSQDGYTGRARQFLSLQGEIKPEIAPLTNDMTQEFTCSLVAFPDYSLAGEIIGLEEERTIVGRKDRVVVRLFEDYPSTLPAFFLVGRGIREHGRDLVSIFGSGEIVQIVDAPGRSQGAGKGALAQAEIMETNHEVNYNDLIFLAMLRVQAVQRDTDDSEEDVSGVQEIWITPEIRPGTMKHEEDTVEQ
ncbi:hypothetical protein [Desulfonatronovibrio magnus]|uniref:hypothetical protein n=1 Tax=Desulfonatronovibrio magnus TaxID=698827 RepID=UPI0005EB97F7|nr:hypothetical protein [Desulfonatronovibrio magnus]